MIYELVYILIYSHGSLLQFESSYFSTHIRLPGLSGTPGRENNESGVRNPEQRPVACDSQWINN